MSNRVAKGNSQGSTMFRQLTRADLITFDREAKDLILEAMDVGCLGRVSSKGHCILRNNAGGSTSIPRNMTSPNRTAQNARAKMKRLLADHQSDPGASVSDLPRRTQRMTVAQAFIEHANTFSRWLDDLPGGLPADQLLEISFDEADEPSFNPVSTREPKPEPRPVDTETLSLQRTRRTNHLKIAPEPGQEAEPDMSAQPEEQDPKPKPVPVPRSTVSSSEEVLARVRDALGEDPRVAVLKSRVTELEKDLAKETERADEAHSRLRLIQEAFHARDQQPARSTTQERKARVMTATIAPRQQSPGPIVLKPYQQQIHDFLVGHPYGGAWLGVGAGKTLSTLSVLQTVRPMGHILVIAPVAIARSTWLDEIEKWGFPIRTKSLIVNENDKKLPKAKRLERFREVFSDPPTMYFVNQELLTQPSQGVRLIEPVPGAAAAPALTQVSSEARHVLGVLMASGPVSQEELVAACRAAVVASGGPAPARSRIVSWIQELAKAGLVTREQHDCRSCQGEGCRECRFGLVDQMPIQNINGQDTLIWPFQTVIIDESQGFKSHSSERFKALKIVRPAITRLIELTGTPSPNGLHDLWSQIYLLDQGEALGKNITEFRNRWFIPKMVPGTTTPSKWIPNPNAKDEIHGAIKHLVMSAQNTNLNLPALTIQNANVTLPPDLMQAYKDFKRDLVLDVVTTNLPPAAQAAFDTWLTTSHPEAQKISADLAQRTGTDREQAYQQHLQQFSHANRQALVTTVVAENQAVLTSKLMQFASGTLYTADPDDPRTKGQYEVIHDKKIEMAEYLVRNSGGDSVLIAYHFRSDLEQLLMRFKKSGIDAQAFNGSREMVRRWNAKRIPVMLLHPAAAGHGLNLQDGGSTMIWYTLPFSLEHYLQTNGRLYRTGQTKPVTIHRLIAKGTQDERMPGVLADKQQVQDDLIEAVSGQDRILAALEEEIQDDLNNLWVSERV